MPQGKLLYAQSGGVTAVINATAAAVIQTARERGVSALAARNGILGALREELYSTSSFGPGALHSLARTPGGAFGSCRFKLKSIDEAPRHYERLIAVMRAHGIRWFLYNGGNDSADTALKLSQAGRKLGYELACIGVPKTVDNDLAITDCSPGFGSIAKYTAVSVAEASLDVQSMMESSTRVFIMEVMGRHAGWVAAAAGLAGNSREQPPHLILFPERPFEMRDFLSRVRQTVDRHGFCVVASSEGIRDRDGRFLADSGHKDAFGHTQLGGVAPQLAAAVAARLGLKCHWAVPDYLQRSARHLASTTDFAQAQAVGRAAVEYALEGRNAVMPVIVRQRDRPYRWTIEPAEVKRIANREKKMPASFISPDGYAITAKARRYLAPLIEGEAPVDWGKDGLPRFARLKLKLLKRKLPEYSV